MVGTSQSTRLNTQPSTRIPSSHSQSTRRRNTEATTRRRNTEATTRRRNTEATTRRRNTEATTRRRVRQQQKKVIARRREQQRLRSSDPQGHTIHKVKRHPIETKKKKKEEKEENVILGSLSWSDQAKNKAKGRGWLGGQYLWANDDKNIGSPAWIEKGIDTILPVDEKETFWEGYNKRDLIGKIAHVGYHGLRGAAKLGPDTIRLISAGAYVAPDLAQDKKLASTMVDAGKVIVPNVVKGIVENPAEFAGGMVGLGGLAGGVAKGATLAAKAVKRGAKIAGKTPNPLKTVTSKSAGKSQRSDISKGKKTKSGNKQEREAREKREEERKKREREARKKREERRKKLDNKRKKLKKEKKKQPLRRKRKNLHSVHKIVKKARIRRSSKPKNSSRVKSMKRPTRKSYRSKEVVNKLPWL